MIQTGEMKSPQTLERDETMTLPVIGSPIARVKSRSPVRMTKPTQEIACDEQQGGKPAGKSVTHSPDREKRETRQLPDG